MRWPKRVGAALLAISLLAVSCAPGAPAPGGDRSGVDQRPAAPKRIVAAMMGNPPTPLEKIIGGGSGGRIPGIDGLEEMVTPGLTTKDEDRGVLVPVLAEAVPSIDSGLWKVFADGRMETAWKIRAGVRWHDGTPVTAEDMVFTARVEQDRDLPVERNPGWRVVDKVEAADPQTVVVTWKTPYIEADDFYSRGFLPRHILERPYQEAKETFTALPYWNVEFVGNGAYRVKEWVRDSHVVLGANSEYVLGRPKIDEIIVKFLSDENAFMANILANEVEVTIGKSITFEQTVSLKEQWRNGRVEFKPETAMKIWAQFVNPSPAVVAEVRFRKAMMHTINRQEMVDSIMSGQSQVAHTVLLPGEPELTEVDSALVKYEFDPRRAVQIIQDLGYARGPDGLFRDAANQPLSVEISSTNEDQNTKPMFATANYWQAIGVTANAVVIPIQRQQDREYRATFPAFTLQGGSSGVAAIKNQHGAQARLPETNYTGNNYARYQNPEFDALIDRFVSTIPQRERMDALRATVRHMTDVLNQMNLYYAMASTMASNRMVNVGFYPTWNAHQWEVR